MAFQNSTIASSMVAVSPSDTTPVDLIGLYVEVTGDVSIKSGSQASTAVLITAVPAGTILPVQISFVMAATTATVKGFKA